MIFDSLENSGRYENAHPLFKAAFDFLKSADLEQLDERTEIDGDKIFALKVVDKGRGKAASPVETHRKYIDVQYTVAGEDLMGWKPVPAGTAGQGYSEEKDLEFHAGEPDQWIRHPQGTFMVFFPEDGHAPMATEEHVSKLVVKVRV
ncbi:MAG: YhcH/YjgK/YiaL family protein [Verrucomicrobiota bacterium]